MYAYIVRTNTRHTSNVLFILLCLLRPSEPLPNYLLIWSDATFVYVYVSETPNLYENNHYHEECLKCNSCGMNLSGPNQKRARRFKNQILCDLHFADMALMESSDFMQQLRNFKPQSLGCAVARRKSSTTLIFPLPPQACSGTNFTWKYVKNWFHEIFYTESIKLVFPHWRH